MRPAVTSPPPIPSIVSPRPAKTDVVPIVAEISEDTGDEPHPFDDNTKNLEAPDAGQLVERMLDLVASEAEALLAGDEERLANLNVRTALAAWDGLHQPDEAMRYLELAESHPLAPRLLLLAALGDGDEAALAKLAAPSPLLALEIAEAWLWRHRRADLAAPLADRALAHADSHWRAHAAELAILAHTALGNWSRVLEIRRANLSPTSRPEDIAVTAALLMDRGNDAVAALALCWTAIEKMDEDPNDRDTAPSVLITRGGWLRVIDVAIDAASRAGDPRRLELLDRRNELVKNLDMNESIATRNAVAAELVRDGQHAEAAKMYAELASDPNIAAPGVAHHSAQYATALAAASANLPEVEEKARRELAKSSVPELIATHGWRALELAANPNPELARAVARAAETDRLLDAIELASPSPSTVGRLEQRGGLSVRWAAAIAEKLGDRRRATELWRSIAESGIGTEYDHLVRMLRSDEDALAEVYEAWGRTEKEPRSAAALQCARGIVDLMRGDFVVAEETLQEAGKLDPKDAFCRAALAAVYRAGKRYDQLAQVLSELSTSLVSNEGRAAAAREYAELLDEHLDDPAGARKALEQMIAERPDDDETMMVLAKLYDSDQQWTKSIDLRQRAVAVAPTPERRADIWLEIGLREDRRGDKRAALVALDKASAITGAGPRRNEVMREQIRIYRQNGEPAKALDIVRSELGLDPPTDRRLQLRREEAQLLTSLDREPEAVVAAYLDVLGFEPDQTEALAGIEAPARKLGMWDELARAFRGAPQTQRNTETLAEALAKIAEWSELAEVRRRQLEAATVPAEKAKWAAEIARLYENEIGDLDAAIRMLVVAQQNLHDDARQQELLRLLRQTARWAEMAQVLERELPTLRAGDAARQVAILLELGELRSEKLDRKADALVAYEGALEREPKNAVALEKLEILYEKLGRERELARLLETRAEVTAEPIAKAQLLDRVAGLRANRGDTDGAIAAYLGAFTANPANREVFTAMERVCYKAERWAAAMQLYETAIQFVEAGQGTSARAYRLGDLYARRGNVQLNFLGQIDPAIASYQKVVEVDSKPEAGVKVLEDICKTRGDWQPLIEAWERRAEHQKEPQRRTSALRHAAALAQSQTDDPRASVRLNRKLLSIDPKDALASATLERYYEDNQDRSGLIDVLKMRLQNAPSHETLDILKKIARASEEGARDVETATEHYQKILELQPENRDALEALGRIYESTEQWAELIDVTRRQIKVTNDRNLKALLYFKCGSVMEAKFGREHDAIRYYDAAIKTSGNCLPAVHGLRDLYRRREEWPRVIETLELEVKLWTEEKERAGVFAQIGRIYDTQLNDPERAMTYYDSALAVDPDCLPANQALFEHYFERSEWDKAMPIATSLAQKAMRDGDPSTRSEFYRKRGVVARQTFDPKAAADSFVVALEIKPTNTAALDDLGELAREQTRCLGFRGHVSRAREAVQEARRCGAFARARASRACIDPRTRWRARWRRDAVSASARDRALGLHRADGARRVPRALASLGPGDRSDPDIRRCGRESRGSVARADAPSLDPRGWRDGSAARDRGAAQRDPGRARASRCVLRARAAVFSRRPLCRCAYRDRARDRARDRTGTSADPRGARAVLLLQRPDPRRCRRYARGRSAVSARDRIRPGVCTASARARAPCRRRWRSAPSRDAVDRGRARGDGARWTTRRRATATRTRAHSPRQWRSPSRDRGVSRDSERRARRCERSRRACGDLRRRRSAARDRRAPQSTRSRHPPRTGVSPARFVLQPHRRHRGERTACSPRSICSVLPRRRIARRSRDSKPRGNRNRCAAASTKRIANACSPRRPRANRSAKCGRRSPKRSRRSWRSRRSAKISHPSRTTCACCGYRARSATCSIAMPTSLSPIKCRASWPSPRSPRRLIVLDRTLLAEQDLPLRFLFGYALEAIRGGYAALLQLGARQRRELAQLLRSLVTEAGEATGAAAEIINNASPRAAKVVERHAGTRDLDPGAWIDSMLACAKRAGLVACDDFSAAIWMVARQAGENLVSADDTVALGSVLGGPDLVRFYLSDQYQMIRDLLSLPS